MIVRDRSKYHQSFHAKGKLLLTGEYFILDGASGLAIPTVLGQSMGISYAQSFRPLLYWKSFDVKGNLWFQSCFEFWHFDLVGTQATPEALLLQKILRYARQKNTHFLREEVEITVETQLDFPFEWGLGSSSTFIYNIARWAGICPFDLLFHTRNGSGHDIACAQAEGPILYRKEHSRPRWEPVDFNPGFADSLYIVHLGKKTYSEESIKYYRRFGIFSPQIIQNVSALTKDFLAAKTLAEFEFVLFAHEALVGDQLHLTPVKKRLFKDYWGEVKSLGAWGGDSVLVTSTRPFQEVADYFAKKGFKSCIPYHKLIF